MKMKVVVNSFYPEAFRKKADSKKYQSKGTCEVCLLLDHIEMDLKNITYRVDHSGKISLKPPFRIHSNKSAGIKPKLVPSIVFKQPTVWGEIEQTIKSELTKQVHSEVKNKTRFLQLDFWEEAS